MATSLGTNYVVVTRVHCTLFSEATFQIFLYFTATGVKCRVAAVKRHSVLHHTEDYIPLSLGIIAGYLENRIMLKPELGVLSSLVNYIVAYEILNKTKCPIFFLLCVLCLQRQPFRFLF